MSWHEYGKDTPKAPKDTSWSLPKLVVITIIVFAALAMLIK